MSAPGEMRLMRYVPGTTPVHRLWAGTKLLSLGALAVALTIRPGWRGLGVFGVVVVAGLVIARIPRSAAPRPPRWLVLLVLVPGGLSVVAGGPPMVDLGGGNAIGIGSLLEWLRFTTLTVLLVAGAALIGWTTPLGDIGPAVSSLGRPLRLVRVPVDEIAAAVGLSIRALPLLGEEMRVLQAARKVRKPETPEGLRNRVRDLHDLLVTAMVSAVRRGREMAQAIESRGGISRSAGPGPRVGRADVAAGLLVCVAAALILVL